MKNAFYDKRPAAFEAVGNSSFVYRWEIKEITNEINNETSYKCFEVIVWGTVTYDKLMEMVINALWGNGIEQKLINDFNAANEGILDESYIEKYKDFLNARKRIKDQIKKDCVTYNIK